MRRNESMVMTSNWAAEIKVACYELQQFKDERQVREMREIAQCVEDMLAATAGKQFYGREPAAGKARSSAVTSFLSRHSVKEKVKKKSEQLEEENHTKQVRAAS